MCFSTSLVWLVIFCEGEEKKKATHSKQHIICRSNVARRSPKRKTDNFRPPDPGRHLLVPAVSARFRCEMLQSSSRRGKPIVKRGQAYQPIHQVIGTQRSNLRWLYYLVVILPSLYFLPVLTRIFLSLGSNSLLLLVASCLIGASLLMMPAFGQANSSYCKSCN